MARKVKRNHKNCEKLGFLSRFKIECPATNAGQQERNGKQRKIKDYNCQKSIIILKKAILTFFSKQQGCRASDLGIRTIWGSIR